MQGIVKAMVYAKEKGEVVLLEVMGVFIVVLGDSNPALLYRDWELAYHGFICIEYVGPYPGELRNEEKRKLGVIRGVKREQDKEMQDKHEKLVKKYRERRDLNLTVLMREFPR